MKNRLVAFVGIVLMIVAMSSCATSRKFGCPTVSKQPIENKNFHS